SFGSVRVRQKKKAISRRHRRQPWMGHFHFRRAPCRSQRCDVLRRHEEEEGVMSYVDLTLPGYRGFGAVAATDSTAECSGPNEARSPVDGDCHCIPGFKADKNDNCTESGLPMWFPNCVDASGKSVPGCV